MEEHVRVYALARDLDADPARILALCNQVGISARNSLSRLTSAQRKIIVGLLHRDGPDGGAAKLVPVPRPPWAGHGRAG
jgi:hypothetical protein